ncbi:MAG: putative toxin-antitoxin system toxin component, PIN family [Candidatus Levyibacteriota bacterium]
MNKASKPTVVIDTNLFISAIIIKGDNAPHKLLAAWREHKYQLLMSEELFVEVDQVLKREKIYKNYKISLEEIEEFITELHNASNLITPLKFEASPLHSRDPKDDKFLACALTGNCDYLITGDGDLLILNGKKELGKLQIIKAADFLQR